jgi:hypothetical protein
MYSTYSNKNYHFIHKYSLIIIVLFTFFILFPTVADAGAESGELFGYKIGDKYPANKNTIVKNNVVLNIFEIVTESPIKPKEIQEVGVWTTVQTFTIIDIISRTKFDSFEKSIIFADKYAAILRAKYPEAIDSIYSSSKILSVELNKKYRLIVDRPSSPVSNNVLIKLEAIGSLRKKLNGLKNKEYNATLLLDASKSEDFTDGL